MIAAVGTPAQKRQFQRCIAAWPGMRAQMARDLLLWAENPGAPVRLFLLPGGALTVSGGNAMLCGRPATPDDWQELAGFLHFVGVERLRSAAPAPAGWPVETPVYCYGLAAGRQLPAGEPPAGLALDRQPPVGQVADFLFGQDAAQRDGFYSETCSALARGMAQPWALRNGAGQIVSTVGVYARIGGEAYLAMGQTAPQLRGQGIGGWLIPALANALAAQGDEVTFLCKPKRGPFYTRLGFTLLREYKQYNIEEIFQ